MGLSLLKCKLRKRLLICGRNSVGVLLMELILVVILGKLDVGENTDRARADVQATAQEGTGDKRHGSHVSSFQVDFHSTEGRNTQLKAGLLVGG